MKQRLQTLLASEKIASSKFADIIGVNRSSISHLLSGRNNPGLDFLQKVLVKFPHINPDWLLLGQGTMYRNSKENTTALPLSKHLFEQGEEKKEPGKQSPSVEKEEKEEPVNISKEPEERAPYNSSKENVQKTNPPTVAKQAERIVFFYSDGTFDTYVPNNSGIK
ncbi:Helix-turn-helix [Saccharicrinis carchari]|uniref:Helix-turn-helix n=1 Tax=Saccharicrinis carchari TaxID=1168039 RepID=A0A521AVK3_SACCC|nr:helix-turn-helix transcriptional regulator [Saccharicrinis carchari]SMO38849.1 Helix-turn-helix [Saccharicrinis carchari]